MSLHLEFCAEFGLSKEDVESQQESQGKGAMPRLS